MMYAVTMGLHVSGPDRAGHFDEVVDAYAELEKVHAELLDCSFGFADHADHADIDVEITVEAKSEDEAFRLVSSGVRSAIQSAGGYTPDWSERPVQGAVYRLTDESVGLVDA